VGKAEPWATMLLRFVGPLTLKVGVGVARSRAEEAVRYVEHHFGRKLHSQNVAMATRIVELAREKGTRRVALEQLLERLRAVG
jgi:2-dehydropantoate 2-reductase